MYQASFLILSLVTPTGMSCLLLLQTHRISNTAYCLSCMPASSCISESVKDSTPHSRAQIRTLGVRIDMWVMVDTSCDR